MTLFGLILLLIVVALLLPLVGVSPDPQIMKVVYILLIVALIAWLFFGRAFLA